MYYDPTATERIAAMGILTAFKSLADKGDLEEIGNLGRSFQNNMTTYPSSFSSLYTVLSRLADKKDLATLQNVIESTLTELQKATAAQSSCVKNN
ncbi:MAG: hypothetical protein FWC32_07535 [Firmicutes bacterium]|nr:hypothetical protein [Bacillota bacterium]